MFWNKADAVFNVIPHQKIYNHSVDVNVMFGNKASVVLNAVPHQTLHPLCWCCERRVPADAMVVVWLEEKLKWPPQCRHYHKTTGRKRVWNLRRYLEIKTTVF